MLILKQRYGTEVPLEFISSVLDNVPTAVFSQPPIGTVGFTEAQALDRYREIDVYKTDFRPLKHTLSGRLERTLVKLVVDHASQRVVGAHMVGADAPEIIQGIGIAVRRADSKSGRQDKPFIADIVAPTGAELNAAIATAAFRVGYERVNSNPTARANYRNAFDAYLAGIPDGQAKTDGVTVGEAAAQAVLAARANDNFYNTAVYSNPAADPGVWQSVSAATPYATAGANDYAMAFTMPLTAASPDARRIKPPPGLTSGKYRRDFEETKAYGSVSSATRTAAMTNVVQFWSESGFTLWSRNVRAIVAARGLDEFEAARVLAAFSVATGDAMLACFESKYAHLFWRPWQAIQRADVDGNPRTHPEPAWAPAVRANHPEYPAGHGCYAGSATEALELLFGDFPVTLTSTGAQVAGWPVVPSANYDSLDEINDDNANARVWGGLHWRTTMERSSRWTAKIARSAVCGEFGLKCDKGRLDQDDD